MSEALGDVEASMTSAVEIITRLDAWLIANASGDLNSDFIFQASEQTIDLERVLYTRSWFDLGPVSEIQFDRLRKKIEVTRKLYRYYLPDLSRSVVPLVELSAEAVRGLCGLLIKAALVRRDPRFLNTALKLLDDVLRRDDCTFPDEIRLLAQDALENLVPMERHLP